MQDANPPSWRAPKLSATITAFGSLGHCHPCLLDQSQKDWEVAGGRRDSGTRETSSYRDLPAIARKARGVQCFGCPPLPDCASRRTSKATCSGPLL
ncbi:hypothetical protein AAHC03_013598 [Spirometra sp. Aus1]